MGVGGRNPPTPTHNIIKLPARGGLLTTPLLAWRLHDGVYAPWGPDADGWWHSEALEVAFQPGHPLMRVRDRDGVELAPSGVLRRHTRALEQQRAEDAQTLARLEQRLEEEVRERTRLEEMVRRLTEQRDGPDTTPPH